MFDLKWSASEKKIARKAYDRALQAVLSKLLVEFKGRAASVDSASDMWEIEDYLRKARTDIDQVFDYRYSQLPFVFARLIHEGHIDEGCLSGLSQEKLDLVRFLIERM